MVCDRQTDKQIEMYVTSSQNWFGEAILSANNIHFVSR